MVVPRGGFFLRAFRAGGADSAHMLSPCRSASCTEQLTVPLIVHLTEQLTVPLSVHLTVHQAELTALICRAPRSSVAGSAALPRSDTLSDAWRTELLFQGAFVSPDLHGVRAGLGGVAGDEVSSRERVLY